MSYSKALVSRDHFFHFFFKSLDFHELWHSVMSTRLITVNTWNGDRLRALLVSLMGFAAHASRFETPFDLVNLKNEPQ